MRVVYLAAAILIAAGGCGSDKKEFTLAPVSGKVTFNKKPLANATVTFVPNDGGPSSTGKTDKDGKFTMKTADKADGAVVGSHRVMITTLDEEEDSENPDEIDYSKKEKIPERYNANTELTFKVPEDGSTSANFDLTK